MVIRNKIWKEATKFKKKGQSNYHNKKYNGSMVNNLQVTLSYQWKYGWAGDISPSSRAPWHNNCAQLFHTWIWPTCLSLQFTLVFPLRSMAWKASSVSTFGGIFCTIPNWWTIWSSPSPPIQGFTQRKGSSNVWKENGSKWFCHFFFVLFVFLVCISCMSWFTILSQSSFMHCFV